MHRSSENIESKHMKRTHTEHSLCHSNSENGVTNCTDSCFWFRYSLCGHSHPLVCFDDISFHLNLNPFAFAWSILIVFDSSFFGRLKLFFSSKPTNRSFVGTKLQRNSVSKCLINFLSEEKYIVDKNEWAWEEYWINILYEKACSN